MANEPLRGGLARAGIDVEQLAAELGVDAKTVQRWLGGRVPRGRHRARIAAVLDRDEVDLWPDIEPAAAVARWSLPRALARVARRPQRRSGPRDPQS